MIPLDSVKEVKKLPPENLNDPLYFLCCLISPKEMVKLYTDSGIKKEKVLLYTKRES